MEQMCVTWVGRCFWPGLTRDGKWLGTYNHFVGYLNAFCTQALLWSPGLPHPHACTHTGATHALEVPQTPEQARLLAARQMAEGVVTRKPAGSRVVVEKSAGECPTREDW